MHNQLRPLDYIVFVFYLIMVAGYGYWIYQRKRNKEANSASFFLAEGSLTWWAIGASMIASNISAEQFIGMSGSGFNIGLAIASYEWMAAATLIIVAIFFMPIYLKYRIFTMPQFLQMRYNSTVSTVMAVFWLLLYVIVNLTSILYLGALAVSTISGFNLVVCEIGLAVFGVIITLGGMKVIGFTDVIQVFFLTLGGLITTYLAVNLVSGNFSATGLWNGLTLMKTHALDHFHMILKKDNAHYMDLPGLAVLIGGLWIVNLNYWGCNQYITQRALGANLQTARSGILFAAFLKLLMPVIVVLPGIAAYVLYRHGLFQTEMTTNGELNPDRAYPVLLNLLPAGLKGMAFAALTAAVVASLAGKTNSISTIFTLDIYKKFIKPDSTERHLVAVGKIAVLASCVLAIAIIPFIGIDKKGGFQYIQEYTGFVSPGILSIFLLGFFWRRTTSSAAIASAILTFILSTVLKFAAPDLPFINRMGVVFLICVAAMVGISLFDNPGRDEKSKGLDIQPSMFRVSPGFLVGTVLVLGIITALYTLFW